MGFTTLQIRLWDDEDCSDVEFLEDLYVCWSGLKSRRYMVPRERGSAGHHSGICAQQPHLPIFRYSVPGML